MMQQSNKEKKGRKSKEEMIKTMVDLYERGEGKLPTVDDLRIISLYLKETFVSKPEEISRKKSVPLIEVSHLAQRYYDLNLNNYNKMGANQLVFGILSFSDEYNDQIGSYPIDALLYEALQKKKEQLVSNGTWFPVGEMSETTRARIRREEEEAAKIRKEFAEGRNLAPYQARTPAWMYLRGDVFVKTTDVKGELLFGEMIGENGFLIQNACSIENGKTTTNQHPSRGSCAVALTIGKVSKVLSVNAVLDNHLIKKSTLINLIKDSEIRVGNGDTMDANTVIEMLEKDPSFVDLEFLFVQKVEIKEKNKNKILKYDNISDLEVKEGKLLGKNAMMDAGRVFMFEMLFGTTENNHFVKRRVQMITKVYTNPMDIRINKIVNTARMQSNNKLKTKSEELFLSTESITDDNRFIRGMDDVRLKIMTNADTIINVIQQSDLNETQKNIIVENIKMVRDKDISLGDIIEMTFDDESPLKKKYLECLHKETSVKK